MIGRDLMRMLKILGKASRICLILSIAILLSGFACIGTSIAYSTIDNPEPIDLPANPSDIMSQQWQGDGNPTNPYLMNGLNISRDREPCIEIRNMANVVVSNCILYHYGLGSRSHYSNSAILIMGAVNVTIVNCTIQSREYGIANEGGHNLTIEGNYIDARLEGMRVGTSGVIIRNNSVTGGEVGIKLWSSGDSGLVSNNTIEGLHEGIWVGGDDWRIMGNSIGSKMTAISLLSGSNNNTIFNNSIGSECASVAYDEGANNKWDDGIATGNRWSDYNGTGNYTVHGLAESIDHYPTVYELASPIDFSGPDIEFIQYMTTFLTADMWITEPMTVDPSLVYGLVSPVFIANVSDTSFIDTVQFCYRILGRNALWKTEQMQLTSGDENESRYAYTLEGVFTDLYLLYYVWANDTNGYSSSTETIETSYNMGIWFYTDPWTPDPLPIWDLVIISVLVIIPGICVLGCVKYSRDRSKPLSRYLRQDQQRESGN
jgi:parallel beta-helix repeat protein